MSANALLSGFMWFGFSGFADEGDDKAMSNDLRTYPPWESNIAMETSILDKLNCSKRLCMESFRCQAGWKGGQSRHWYDTALGIQSAGPNPRYPSAADTAVSNTCSILFPYVAWWHGLSSNQPRYLIVLMDMLNFGIVFPLLPSIAEEFNANAMQAAGLTSGIVTCYLIGGCSQATTNKFYCISIWGFPKMIWYPQIINRWISMKWTIHKLGYSHWWKPPHLGWIHQHFDCFNPVWPGRLEA